jgi:hypothetical protein
MELTKFIKDNNINDFHNLKNILESEIFKLKIKEDNSLPNLFLIYNTEESNFDAIFVKECNGIILDKNTFKIVCYTFDKCNDSDKLNEIFDMNNLYLEPSLEGTLLRLYYYDDKWILSTKKCINANNSKWLSQKSFFQLFLECFEENQINYLFENLNKNLCYSFILTHPENNIIIQNEFPKLYHVSTRDLDTLNEIYLEENVLNCQKLIKQRINKELIYNEINKLINDTDLLYEGYFVIDNNFNRQKFKNIYFNKLKLLWGNTNNRFFRYLELRKDFDLLNQYLYYFKKDIENFKEYENEILNLAEDIFIYYKLKHINKKTIKIPYYFSKVLYIIHGNYIKTKEITNIKLIMEVLWHLDAKQLCFIKNKNIENKNNPIYSINFETDMEI